MELTNKLRSEFYPYYLLIMLSPSRTCNWLPKHSTFSIWIYTLYQQESISLRGTFFHLCRSCFASFFFFFFPTHILNFSDRSSLPSRVEPVCVWISYSGFVRPHGQHIILLYCFFFIFFLSGCHTQGASI